MRNKSIKKKKLITSHKLLSEKGKLYAAIDSSMDIVGIVDLEGNIKTVNKGFTKITGYEPEEIIGKRFTKVQAKKDVSKALNAFKEIIEKGSCKSFDLDFLSKDGRIINTLATGTLLRDEQGRPSNAFLIAKDVTERKKAEEDIARQAKLLDLIFKYSLDSIVLLDKDYNFIWVSETYAKSCQRDSSEFAGHNHFEFYPSNLKEEFDAVKKGKSIYRKYARPFIFPDHPEWGTTYWDLGLAPILDDDGEIEMFLFTLKDVTDRRLAEQKSVTSEALLRSVLETTPDIIVARDLNSQVTYFNQGFVDIAQKLWGVTVHVGLNTLVLYSPELQLYWEKIIARVLEGDTHTEQFEWKYSEEESRHYELMMMPIVEEGQIIGTAEFTRDITDRIQSELQIREMASFAELNPAPVLRVNPDGIIISCNPASMEILGKNAKKGISIYSILPDLSKIDLNKCIHGNMLLSQEVDIKGRFFLFVLRGVSDLKLLHIYGSDITERKKSEEQLIQAEQRYRTVADFTYDWEWWQSREGKYIYMSPSCERISGYKWDEFTNNPHLVDEVILPEDQEVWRKHNIEVQTTHKPVEVQFRIKRKDGCVRWIEHICQPVKDTDGEFMGFRASNRDITKRRQMEEEANRLRSEYLHIARVSAMGELTASLAHELKQPLAAIRSNAQAAQRFLANEKPDLDELSEILVDIIKDNRRADEIIGRLRTLMRKSELQITELNINNVIQEIFPLIRSYEIMRNISLEFELDDKIPSVAGDRVQLQQVILNLIINSSEALENITGDIRRIVIRTSQKNHNNVTVAIRDNGIGIDEQSLDSLFEPFYTTKQEGMGMGLSISRSIIEAHGGNLWAKNNPDRGATFYFTIPVFKSSLA